MDGADSRVTLRLAGADPGGLLGKALPVVEHWLGEWTGFALTGFTGHLTLILAAGGAEPAGGDAPVVPLELASVHDKDSARLAVLAAALAGIEHWSARVPAPPPASPPTWPAGGDELEPFGAGELAVFIDVGGDEDRFAELEARLETVLDGVALPQESGMIGTVGQWVLSPP